MSEQQGRIRGFRRSLAILIAGVAALVGMPVGQSVSAQAADETVFFGGTGFATRVIGGGLPVQSGRTAHSWLGCTSDTGVQSQNDLVAVDLGGLIDIAGSTTTNQSVRRPNGARGSITTNEVGAVQIGTDELNLTINGLYTEARAFRQPDGSFTRGRDFSIGTVSLGVLGEQLELPVGPILQLLLEGDGIELSAQGIVNLLNNVGLLTNPDVLGFLFGQLGLGDLWNLLETLGLNAVLQLVGGVTGLVNTLVGALVGQLDVGDGAIAAVRARLGGTRATAEGSQAGMTGLRVELLDAVGEPTHVIISRSVATAGRIDGARTGGFAYAADLNVLGGVVGTGKVANQNMPCEGTGGQWRENATAGVNIPGVINVGAAASRTRSFHGPNGGTNAYAQTEVAGISLLGGQLEIGALQTRAHTRKNPNGSRMRSSDGTTVASIRVGGREIALPNPGQTIEVIPGVAEITIGKEIAQPRGLRVVGLEVRLLQEAAVLELGVVRAIVH